LAFGHVVFVGRVVYVGSGGVSLSFAAGDIDDDDRSVAGAGGCTRHR
jgi:hypothetical protein